MATVSDLITRCRLELIDTGGSPRWTDPEFLGFYNQFLEEVASLAPDRVSATQNLNFVAGAKQTLPASVRALVAVVRNSNGEACTPFDLDLLQRFDPTWIQAPTSTTVKQYAYNPDVPRVVYVNPPLAGSVTVEAIVVPVLTAAAAVGNTVAIADDVIPAAVNYMMYRACFKDAEDTAMAAKADHYFGRMKALLEG